MGIKLNRKILGLGAVLFGIAFGSVAANAGAVLVLIDDEGGTVVVLDNLVGDDDLTVGVISYSGAIGDWSVTTEIGLTKPIIGSASQPQVDLASVNASSSDAGVLIVLFSDTDFESTGGNMWFDLAIGGTTDGSVYTAGCYNADNTNWTIPEEGADPGECQNVFLDSPELTGVPFAWSDGGSVATSGSPFALGVGISISHDGAGVTTLDANLRVPEPGILGLFGFGLLGMGIAARRRQKA